MKDFSLEDASSRINSESTKEYFKEALSSYYIGNNRAAIVTLYSIVICDLISKLESLKEIYNDETATNILSEISKIQEKNRTKSDWENILIDKVYKETKLLDNVDMVHINSLQSLRHLCAHPVINKEDKLFTPNNETVAAHIRNMLESLFLKPPVLSKKILSTILEDIENKKDILVDSKSTELYIKSKYLLNLNPTIEVSIFRELWKIVFKVNDKKCNENRAINYKLLYLLYNRNSKACLEKIKSDLTFFSNIENTSNHLNVLISFLSENEFLVKIFPPNVLLLVKNQVKNNIDANCVAWFLSKSFVTHIESVKKLHSTYFEKPLQNDISIQAIKRFLIVGKTKGFTNEIIGFIIWRYKSAQTYSDADKVFEYYVKPHLNDFNENHLIEICDAIKLNDQVCDRSRAKSDHQVLLDKCNEIIGQKFKKEDYPQIFKG